MGEQITAQAPMPAAPGNTGLTALALSTWPNLSNGIHFRHFRPAIAAPVACASDTLVDSGVSSATPVRSDVRILCRSRWRHHYPDIRKYKVPQQRLLLQHLSCTGRVDRRCTRRYDGLCVLFFRQHHIALALLRASSGKANRRVQAREEASELPVGWRSIMQLGKSQEEHRRQLDQVHLHGTATHAAGAFDCCGIPFIDQSHLAYPLFAAS